MRRRPGLLAFALVALLVLGGVALARPGGGGGYSGGGGGGHGGGGGGGDAAGLVWLLIRLCITYPKIGLPLVAIIVIAIVVNARLQRRRANYAEWSTTQTTSSSTARESRESLRGLSDEDPDFSLVLFEDFLYALVHEAHSARGADKALDRLAAYVTPAARAQLAKLGPTPVEDVIIGALALEGVTRGDPNRVTVRLDLNLTEAGKSAWAVERWTLERPRGRRSRPLARASVVDCPSCGAPLEQVLGGVCATCKEPVVEKRFDWAVVSVERLRREARPLVLLQDAVEEGTSLPTRVDPLAEARFSALGALDSTATWPIFTARVKAIFEAFGRAWSARDLRLAAPFLSDTLLRAQERWAAAYTRAGLRNVTAETRIERIELAQLVTDRWLHAVTVRVHAVGLDYTVRDADGAVVGGSKTRPRRYTEYWTLVRSVARRGDGPVVCPTCGAQLELTMAGPCPYCKSQVVAAAFDWVLSRIEQDETYTG